MRRRPLRLVGWCGAIVLLAYVALAGGTDDNSVQRRQQQRQQALSATRTTADADCVAGTISGAGATFPQAMVQQWIKDYAAACPGATVGYQPVGSGAGIQQLTAATVDFGASDAVMKPEERQAAEAARGPVLHIPWTAGGIAVVFHLDGVSELRLRPETLASIFAGTINRWNDPAIALDNRAARLPDRPIQVVHRSDGSGTTQVFTSFLTAVAPQVWTAGAGKDVAWPAGQGAKGSDGVTAVVKQSDGAVSYAEASFAEANGLGVAKIRNRAGRFVGPTPEAVTAAIEDATVPPNLEVQVTFTPSRTGAYPISTTTWALVPRRLSDPVKARLLQSFLLYALGSEGQADATPLHYAPLPRRLAVAAQAAVYEMQAG